MGKPTIALHITERTKKVKEKLLRMMHKEEEQMTQQTENLTSIVSHEIRTPIGNMIFFLQQIINILQKLAEVTRETQIQNGIYYCQIMMS